MVNKLDYLMKPLLILAVLSAGCSGAAAQPVAPSGPVPAQSTTAQPEMPASPPASQPDSKIDYGSSTNPDATGSKSPSLPANRVDVIYFHVNQRCVTCLCFEDHINNVIEKYFQDAIASGKLTYRVLNAQTPQNTEIAKEYGAVGSQLFINTITDGKDHIEDIDTIWYWNCRNNPQGFELKVKNAIELRLKGLG